MQINSKNLGNWVFDSDDICLIYDDNYYTYQDVKELCTEYYSDWYKFGERKLILLDCDDSFESYIFLIGARIFNSVLLLVSKDINILGISNIINKFLPSYIISSRSFDLNLNDYIQKKFFGKSIFIRNNFSVAMHPDLSILFTTSGTTGSVKLCKVSNQNLSTSSLQIINSLGITKSDKAISTLPISYVYGYSILNSHLSSGASFVINKYSIFTDSFWASSKKNQITNFGAVPFQLRMIKKIYKDHFHCINSLRHVSQAGGPLDRDTALFIYSKSKIHNFKFFMMYGQTEASSRIAYKYIEKEDDIGYLGNIVIGGELIGLKNFKPNSQYELIYKGKNVFMGYATCSSDLITDDNPTRILNTGDIIQTNDLNRIKIIRRKNRICKINGVRIMLDQIESLLLSFGIESACLNVNDEYIIVFYESSKILDVFEIIKKNTTLNKRNIKIIKVELLPRNLRGKINYNSLKKNYEL